MAANYRTDLAAERIAALHDGMDPIPGVNARQLPMEHGELTVVDVTGEEGAHAIGKPRGRYVTARLEMFGSGHPRSDAQIETMARALRGMLPNGRCLVVGLGNQSITPDALGPRTAAHVLPTRHIAGDDPLPGFDGLRQVAVIAPGVLGQTGMEAGEIARALTGTVRPACIIAVDALAAGEPDWLGCTLQMTDTGISPGSGVQNRRKELTAAAIGVPVIALGVPTVIDAPGLRRNGEPLMVTPRDIDRLIEDAAECAAMVINRALFPELSLSELRGLI